LPLRFLRSWTIKGSKRLGVRGITPVMFSGGQLKRAASLTEEAFVQLGKYRAPASRNLL
jgi:hypothetical protein